MRFVAIKVDLQTYIKIEHCLFRFFLIVRAPRFADLFFFIIQYVKYSLRIILTSPVLCLLLTQSETMKDMREFN